MEQRIITVEILASFRQHLILEERSPITIEKYLRDVGMFFRFASQRPVTKELVLCYKNHLLEHGYAVRSINSMLAALNNFLDYLGCQDCKVKSLRVQRQIFSVRRQRAYQKRVLASVECFRKTPTAKAYSTNHLCHRDPGVGASLFHSRSDPHRRNLRQMQKQDTHDSDSCQAAKIADCLCEKRKNPFRGRVSGPERETIESELYLGTDEIFVQCGRCKEKQSLST